MPALADVAREKCRELERQHRRRVLQPSLREDGVTVMRDGKRLISFSCNDYLCLSQHPQVKAAAIEATKRYGTGAGASRLVTGNHPLYGELETALAAWKGTEAALVFGSGYLANSGIIPARVGKGDLIVADKLVHACLIDGAQLSGAQLMRFKHNDMEDCARILAERSKYCHCLIVTDEVFSMDGDIAPLAELEALASAHDAWLMTDGAHSITPTHTKPDLAMGTLSKAFGSYGGYVCGRKEIIDYLATSARSFIFSTGLPPAVIAASIAALRIIEQDSALVSAPLAKARLFTQALDLPLAQSPIVPLILGDESRALAAAQLLEGEGFLVSAIRPPTVPQGTSRLRFTFSANHRDEDILRVAEVIRQKGLI